MQQRIAAVAWMFVSPILAQDWAQQFPSLVPPGAYSTRMAYDAGRAMMVQFGGFASTAAWPPPQALQQTWVLQNNTWSQRLPAASPPARGHHAMVYNAAMQAVVLFGGMDANGSPLNDIWWYDGVNWNTTYYSLAPAPRANPAMTGDGTIMVFGGFSPPFTYFGDTWGWSPTSGWSQSAVGGPPPRRNAALGRFQGASTSGYVLHGGRNFTTSNLSDTWVMTTGTSGWQLLPNAGGPAREEHGMAFDPLSGQTFFCSGHHVPTTTTGFANDLWRFDGTTWTEMPTATRPIESIGAAVAMDTARNRLVLFGGGTGMQLSAVSNEHWEFTPPAVPQYFGADCLPSGLSATFHSTFAGRGTPWTLSLGSSPVNAITFAVFAVGFSSSSWGGVPLPVPLGAIGLPACQLLVEPVVTPLVPVTAGVLGSYGATSIAIPNTSSVYGLELYAQAIAGNATGLRMASRACHVQVW